MAVFPPKNTGMNQYSRVRIMPGPARPIRYGRNLPQRVRVFSTMAAVNTSFTISQMLLMVFATVW